jgi:hypothetical protein
MVAPGAKAPCVLVCGFCIGTDKLGHMFQQGRMAYQVYLDAKAQGKSDEEARKQAEAFSKWTEGLYKESDYDRDTTKALEEGSITLQEHGWNKQSTGKLKQRWGGRTIGKVVYPLEASKADHAANMQGMKMWQWLERMRKAGGKFGSKQEIDICDWVTKDLQDFQKAKK